MHRMPLLRSVFSLLGGVALLLLIPLLAMQFTREVSWTAFDFAVAGFLLFGAGTTYILGSRIVRSATHRVILATAVVLVLATVWAELAVGIFH